MDISTAIGLVAGAVVIATLILMGGDFRMLYDIHAIIIIFGGSTAATLIRFPVAAMLHGLPLGARFAFTLRRKSQRELVDDLASLAEVEERPDRPGEGGDRRAFSGQWHPLRCRGRLYPRQPRPPIS